MALHRVERRIAAFQRPAAVVVELLRLSGYASQTRATAMYGSWL
jgi:hypothetical protein